nr:hypothetical protein Iba_chr03bCG11850 [Ipomoea batatas]
MRRMVELKPAHFSDELNNSESQSRELKPHQFERSGHIETTTIGCVHENPLHLRHLRHRPSSPLTVAHHF